MDDRHGACASAKLCPGSDSSLPLGVTNRCATLCTRPRRWTLEAKTALCRGRRPRTGSTGPYTFLARSEGRIIAGVELWQQQRDRYWFLEVLVRDQSPRYKGVGHELVDAALEWLAGVNVKRLRRPCPCDGARGHRGSILDQAPKPRGRLH